MILPAMASMPGLVLPPAAFLPPIVSLLLVLLGVGLLTAAATALFMAEALLRPPRMTDGKALFLLRRLTPDDLGLAYERLDFTIRDEHTCKPLSLAAWWVPAEEGANADDVSRDRCAVLIHGYADAKVGAIAWAPVWHALGYHLLVPDLRAHGESGGKLTTAGYFERHDLVQAINQWRAQKPGQTRSLVLFGASMGATVAAATAAALEPGDVSAVVLESPFADFRTAASAHMDRVGVPGGPIRCAALRLAQALSGADYGALRMADLIAALPCPVMVISPAEDVYLRPGDADVIRSAVEARGEPNAYWRTEAAGHLMAVVHDPAEYRRRLAAFLGEAEGTERRDAEKAVKK
jgi:pimeloyl-ACP methyl ester carboxylesterase